MKIHLELKNAAFHLEAKNEEGATVHIDGSKEIGGENLGFTPMQLLLAGAGGCSAIDVISILKKQKQKIESLKIEVEGEKEKVESHSEWRKIHLKFLLEGVIDKEKAVKALDLSMERYCSVSKSLQPKSTFTYEIRVNGQ